MTSYSNLEVDIMRMYQVNMERDGWQLFSRRVKANSVADAKTKARKRKWFKTGRISVVTAYAVPTS